MYSLVYKNKKFVAGVIGLVSLSFLLWLLWVGGIGDIANIGQNCVAKVDGSCITLRDYRRELLRYGDLVQNKDMERLLREQVLESLIVQELLYAKAKKLGFLASNQEVIDLIKSDPSFQENGIFSTSKYKESLARLGLEPTEYEEYIRKILTIQKLLNLIGNAVYLTPKEEEINLLSQSFEISGRLYIINPEDVPVSASEKEILDFYTQNRENFKREPTKVVRLWIEKDKQKAEEIYKALRNRQEVPNFKEFKLPQQEGEFPTELKGELNRLSPADPISLVKTGEGYAIVFLFKEETGGYKPPSILQVEGAKDIAVEIYSMSKGFSMAGWRVAFVLGNEILINNLAHLKSYLDYGVFTPIQVASIIALESPYEIVEKNRDVYQRRRDVLVEGLNRIGWPVEKPKASMFVWAKIPEWVGMNSLDFSLFLLKEAKVAVSPGIGFGEYGEGYVRFALVENEHRIRQAVRGIKKALERFKQTVQ